MEEISQSFSVFKSEQSEERLLSRQSQHLVAVNLLPIRSVPGPVILVFSQTKKRLPARKSVSERHHFFAGPERTILSLEG